MPSMRDVSTITHVLFQNYVILTIYSFGAGNYQQPQLPTGNTVDAFPGTERYSLFM